MEALKIKETLNDNEEKSKTAGDIDYSHYGMSTASGVLGSDKIMVVRLKYISEKNEWVDIGKHEISKRSESKRPKKRKLPKSLTDSDYGREEMKAKREALLKKLEKKYPDLTLEEVQKINEKAEKDLSEIILEDRKQ